MSLQPHRKWQNLHIGLCPMVGCENMLMDAPGIYEIVKCANPACDFKIRVDRLNDILLDKNHAANKFPLK